MPRLLVAKSLPVDVRAMDLYPVDPERSSHVRVWAPQTHQRAGSRARTRRRTDPLNRISEILDDEIRDLGEELCAHLSAADPVESPRVERSLELFPLVDEG